MNGQRVVYSHSTGFVEVFTYRPGARRMHRVTNASLDRLLRVVNGDNWKLIHVCAATFIWLETAS